MDKEKDGIPSEEHRVSELAKFPKWIKIMWLFAILWLFSYAIYYLSQAPSLMKFVP